MEESVDSDSREAPVHFAAPLTPLSNSLVSKDGITQPTSPDRHSFRAESLSPASSSSGSITDLGSRLEKASGSAPPKDADAKSSALKALQGISKVVSRSRQVDAEALQAIKAQRAKVKAEGGGASSQSQHRHTRTLSTDSIPSLPDLSGASMGPGVSAGSAATSTSSISSMLPPSGGSARSHHRRSRSGVHVTPSTSPLPRSSPQTYSEILSGMNLADLLALQSAVEAEIQTQLACAGLALSGGSSHSPPQSPVEPLISAQQQYAAAALLANQQQQQVNASALALQQALAGVAANMGFDQPNHMPSGGSSSRSVGHSPLGRSPTKASQPPHRHSRSQSIDAGSFLRSSSPLGPSSTGSSGSGSGALAAAVSAGSNRSVGGMEGFNMDLSRLAELGIGTIQGPPTARSLDVGAPQPPPSAAATMNSSDFSFLSQMQPSQMDLTVGQSNSLLVPQAPPATSPFSNTSGAGLMPLQFAEQSPTSYADQQQQQPATTTTDTQQLPLLFGNLQLGGLDTWR